MQIKKLPKEYWPEGLNELPQLPKELYILGEFPDDENLIYLSVVGSRKFTSYGRDACQKLIAGLAGYPIVIVSGFAMGIDTIALNEAMSVGLRTIAFPGSGLSMDALYPKINQKMIEEVLASGGCFISEFEPEFRATQWSFPMRNRLMAGISSAVLIIEAEEKSGTMITARLAVEYNKDVLAVPGSIFSTNSQGTNKLIRAGATPVTSAEDVLEALGFERKTDEIKQAQLFEDLSPEERSIIELLREPLPKDELVRTLKMPIQNANALISIMEIKGLIKEELGYVRIT